MSGGRTQSWGLPGCRRGDQRPQVTPDPKTHGVLQEGSFDCDGYGRAVTQVEGQ